jgi:hypothetical protein
MNRNIIVKTHKDLCLIFSESDKMYYVCNNDTRKDIRFYSYEIEKAERFLQQWAR